MAQVVDTQVTKHDGVVTVVVKLSDGRWGIGVKPEEVREDWFLTDHNVDEAIARATGDALSQPVPNPN